MSTQTDMPISAIIAHIEKESHFIMHNYAALCYDNIQRDLVDIGSTQPISMQDIAFIYEQNNKYKQDIDSNVEEIYKILLKIDQEMTIIKNKLHDMTVLQQNLTNLKKINANNTGFNHNLKNAVAHTNTHTLIEENILQDLNSKNVQQHFSKNINNNFYSIEHTQNAIKLLIEENKNREKNIVHYSKLAKSCLEKTHRCMYKIRINMSNIMKFKQNIHHIKEINKNISRLRSK